MFNIYVFNYAQMLFIIYARKRIEHDLLIIKKYVFITYVLPIPPPGPTQQSKISTFSIF